jgi:hypothetical protein
MVVLGNFISPEPFTVYDLRGFDRELYQPLFASFLSPSSCWLLLLDGPGPRSVAWAEVRSPAVK